MGSTEIAVTDTVLRRDDLSRGLDHMYLSIVDDEMPGRAP
jgi:hypothetical protein